MGDGQHCLPIALAFVISGKSMRCSLVMLIVPAAQGPGIHVCILSIVSNGRLLHEDRSVIAGGMDKVNSSSSSLLPHWLSIKVRPKDMQNLAC